MDNDHKRLIEVGFPLRQTSLDSVREKYGPKGHISGLHLWPARRPLAACRAALIAALLPDPGDESERKRILERLAGHVVQRPRRQKGADGRIIEEVKEETEGGILRWGRESGPELEWFRDEIRRAYGGRAPRVLDPFAGGGAIPLEAMRLGCEAVAGDINPVAYFILKCTLEYPQKLAGQRRLLPRFALESPEFMAEFIKAGRQGKKRQGSRAEATQAPLFAAREADLAWHVRAWGHWVLERARADVERLYPSVDGKPTVAYLWARTVPCKACGATIPLLKTRWLCKKEKKRVLLSMAPNLQRTDVDFGVQTDVPQSTGNAGQRREHDKRLAAGTMSRSGVTCPCCGAIMTMEDLRFRGQAGQLGATMTAAVVDGRKGKEYRLPTGEERRLAGDAAEYIPGLYAQIPFGLPEEPTPKGGGGASRAFSVDGYGLDRWHKLFTPRQLLALGAFVMHIRAAQEAMLAERYPAIWVETLTAYLAATLDRLVDQSTTIATWYLPGENVKHTFVRYALPITWDFAETNPIGAGGGTWSSALLNSSAALENILRNVQGLAPSVTCGSATDLREKQSSVDLIVTDPPYYDAIPYSDLMDLFYIWLRRVLHGTTPHLDEIFRQELAPKWDADMNEGELIDDASRFGGDSKRSKAVYEEGMSRALRACYAALKPEGYLLVVFAHKQPDAWETLVSALVRAGFVGTASWPIQTENATRSRARSSSALASSLWLMCRKRPETARPGWDNRVLQEMRGKLTTRLRDFWDAGIRGPDFVWAATGPALEAYSRYPVVHKANQSGRLEIPEFLRHVRRMVVDFVVGRILSPLDEGQASELDDVTTYYLLHRQSFQCAEAPVGACILYAVSCNLSEQDLVGQYDLLAHGKGRSAEEDEAGEGEANEKSEKAEVSGSQATLRLKRWQERQRKNLGYEGARGRGVPLIDRIHRLLQLWRAGDVAAVDEYLESQGLLPNPLFHQALQALIELERQGNGDREVLESISNHVGQRSGRRPAQQALLEKGMRDHGETTLESLA